ncbi:MAG: DUF5702 domain-containing protein [Clostridiales bacterium]|nr:DUF5702 domain-containing protein [Clostridiales bacterium]
MTVFLALSLTLILSLVFTVIEGARISAIRMKFECAADIGLNSVLAEYHRELLEQYDLLFVDMSYGGGTADISNTEAHLRNYLQNNLQFERNTGVWTARDFLNLYPGRVSIKEYSIASDNEGEVLKRQVTDYMSDYSMGALLEKISAGVDQLNQFGLDTKNIEQERHKYEARIDEIGLPEKEVEEGVYEEVPLNNPADIANATRSSGVLNLVLEDSSQISAVKINPEDYISHRFVMQGTGLCQEAAEISGEASELVFEAYLFEKCGYFGQELDKSLLKYQIEYILAGEDTDWENLEQVAKRLLRWREAANVLYILSDSSKVAEAKAMALALTAVALCPELAEPVKYTILFAWAYVESLQDVKTLLSGGRVPVMKTAADWKTGINSIKNVRGSLSDDSGGSGLNYKEYLQIMLFLQGSTDRTYRAMDIMEMDIRTTPGNGRFRMDGCFDTYQADLSISSGFGYSYEMTRRYGFY